MTRKNSETATAPSIPTTAASEFTLVFCPECKKYQATTKTTVDTDARFIFSLECGHELALELRVINNGKQVKENLRKEEP